MYLWRRYCYCNNLFAGRNVDKVFSIFFALSKRFIAELKHGTNLVHCVIIFCNNFEVHKPEHRPLIIVCFWLQRSLSETQWFLRSYSSILYSGPVWRGSASGSKAGSGRSPAKRGQHRWLRLRSSAKCVHWALWCWRSHGIVASPGSVELQSTFLQACPRWERRRGGRPARARRGGRSAEART